MGTCDRCGQADETSRFTERPDGSRFIRTDGSQGESDLMLCDDCAAAWLEEEA